MNLKFSTKSTVPSAGDLSNEFKANWMWQKHFVVMKNIVIQGVFNMSKSSRPVFLNLMQIQMPVGALTSIGHRVTGVLLALGLPFGLYLFYLSLNSEETFATMMGWLSHPAIHGVVIILVWALAHHLLAGVRHLLTDINVGSTLHSARRSAWLVNLSAVAIALIASGVLL